MLVTLLGERGGWHVQMLGEALGRSGHTVEVVSWQSVGAAIGPRGHRFTPKALSDADVVAVRGMPGVGAGLQRLEEVIFRMDAVAQLEATGMPVVNSSRSLEIAIDKYLSLALLARAGIRVPRTTVVQGEAAARLAWNEFGGTCVAKPLFGSRGRGIRRVETAGEAATIGGDGVTYLQEFIPHPGWDLRVLVVGDEAFAMRRMAAAGEWRTNVSLGGRPEAVEASADEVGIARRAAATVGARIAGVDILPGPDGPVVLEVNAVPAWRGLQSVVHTDLAEAVATEVTRAARIRRTPKGEAS